MSKDGWTIAPCKGCGCEIEDEGPVTEDSWWCSQCWPNEDRKRLRAKVKELESQIAGTDIPTRDAERLEAATQNYSRMLAQRDAWIDKHAAVCDELHALQVERDRLWETARAAIAAMEAWKKWGTMPTAQHTSEEFRVAMERAIHLEDEARRSLSPSDDSLDTHTADESHECNGKWKPYPSVFCSKLHKEPK